MHIYSDCDCNRDVGWLHFYCTIHIALSQCRKSSQSQSQKWLCNPYLWFRLRRRDRFRNRNRCMWTSPNIDPTKCKWGLKRNQFLLGLVLSEGIGWVTWNWAEIWRLNTFHWIYTWEFLCLSNPDRFKSISIHDRVLLTYFRNSNNILECERNNCPKNYCWKEIK